MTTQRDELEPHKQLRDRLDNELFNTHMINVLNKEEREAEYWRIVMDWHKKEVQKALEGFAEDLFDYADMLLPLAKHLRHHEGVRSINSWKDQITRALKKAIEEVG